MPDPLAEVKEPTAEEVTKAEAELEQTVADKLEETFGTKPVGDPPAAREDTEDSTPEDKPDEKPAEDEGDPDEPTPEEAAAELKLEEEQKLIDQADAGAPKKEEDSKPTEDPDGNKAADSPVLSSAYRRAAKHQGWTEEEIDEQFKVNPELTVRTLGKLYEATNRASQDFAAVGRKTKELEAQKVEATKVATAKTQPVIDLEKLKDAYEADDPTVKAIEALMAEVQELKTAAPAPGNEDGQQAVNAVDQQIRQFFDGDDLKGYEDFYGNVPAGGDFNSLTGTQYNNRIAMVNMAQDIVVGSSMAGREMPIDEGMRRAHLSMTEEVREKVIIKKIKAKVQKRGKSLTLKPSNATEPPKSTGPKSMADIEASAGERLNKVFG